MKTSKKAKIICMVNQKGGVGKTTTTINLATALAAVDHKVLLIDMDPQSNTTTGLGLSVSEKKGGIYHALSTQVIRDEMIKKTLLPHLSIIGGTEDLAAFDMEVLSLPNREYILRDLLEPVRAAWDFILIDCPPALNMLTLNSLVSAQSLIIPLQCEFFALQGLAQLLKTIERVKKNFNPHLSLLGVVLTMYEKRNNLCQWIEKDVRGYLKSKVFETVIPRNVKVSESSSYGKPLIFYDFKSAASQAYLKLAREVLDTLQK